MQHSRLVFIALLALAALGWQSQSVYATHTTSGGTPLAHIDQISIDLGPAGTNVGVEGNGKPAVGDRDSDGVVDAEGAAPAVFDPTNIEDGAGPGSCVDALDNGGDFRRDANDPDCFDTPGICGNGLDDDQLDINGSTVIGDSPGEIDGVADDGCQVTLTPLETCAEIIDDGVLNADEDFIDTLSVDVTVGAQPGSGPGTPGGISPVGVNGGLVSWQYGLNWSPEFLRINSPQNLFFLINAGGAAQPFTNASAALPDLVSPWTAAVADGLGGDDADDGAGVLNRIGIEGDVAGIATLSFSGVFLEDRNGIAYPIDLFNGAQIAVSKDGPDAGTTIGDSPGEQYDCDQDDDGIDNPDDNCPFDYNPTQRDSDGNGLGDACDPDADTDGDGIQDPNDACPELPGIPSRMGCPEPAVGGMAELLASAEPEPASRTSDDERRHHTLQLALAGGAAALIAASLGALRLRRRR